MGKKDLPVTGEKDATLDQAITLDIIVARGRYALYSVGKTPTSQAVYDTNQHIARVLCLGDGAGSEIRLKTFGAAAERLWPYYGILMIKKKQM